jgi:hypothetical protein
MNRFYQILDSIQSFVSNSNVNIKASNDNLEEYKQDFYEMNIGSLRAIVSHAQAILDSINDPKIKENLTESWLQGKIAITEDYMRTIHDFVKYVPSDDDDSYAADRPGLWENIRKKKEREGKDYKPAKRGDKDRPDPEAWKNLTKDDKTKKKK